jgi:hypothetical protein
VEIAGWMLHDYVSDDFMGLVQYNNDANPTRSIRSTCRKMTNNSVGPLFILTVDLLQILDTVLSPACPCKLNGGFHRVSWKEVLKMDVKSTSGCQSKWQSRSGGAGKTQLSLTSRIRPAESDPLLALSAKFDHVPRCQRRQELPRFSGL